MEYIFEISWRETVTVDIEADSVEKAWDIVQDEYNDNKYEIERLF